MTLPVINAIINFSTGPSFAQAMILGEGILDTNILSDSAAVIVDVSDVVDSIQTNRGRNPQADQFQTGTLTLRIVDQNGDFNPQNPSSPYFGLLDPMRKVAISATYSGVPVGTIKLHATGKGNANKDAMVAAMQAKGHPVTDDNEADALAILHWAMEQDT